MRSEALLSNIALDAVAAGFVGSDVNESYQCFILGLMSNRQLWVEIAPQILVNPVNPV